MKNFPLSLQGWSLPVPGCRFETRWLGLGLGLLLGVFSSPGAAKGAEIIGWGSNTYGQIDIPENAERIVAVAAGSSHSLALDGSGRVIAWGDNSRGQASVPPNLSNVIAIAAGAYHSLALTAEGRVWAWGAGQTNGSWSDYGQSMVPENLSNAVAIVAEEHMNLALTRDGKVVAWGAINNGDGYDPAYVPIWLDHVIAISTGQYDCFALLADGTFVHWTADGVTVRTSPTSVLTNLVAVTGGGPSDLALTADGQVLRWAAAWSRSRFDEAALVPDLDDVIAVTTSWNQSIAILRDGNVWTDPEPADAPPGSLTNVLAISTPDQHGLALVNASSAQALAPEWVVPHHWMAMLGYPLHQNLLIKNGADAIGVSGLPDGLAFDPIKSRVVGTPNEAGNFEVTLNATNATGTASQTLMLHVNVAKPLLYPPVLTELGLGLPCEFRIPSHYTDTHQATNLPPGLTLDTARGIIHGAPREEGDFPVALVASNRYGMAQSNVVLRVTSVFGSQLTSAPIPSTIHEAIDVSHGYDHTLVVNGDGRMVAWTDAAYQNADRYENTVLPGNLTNIVRVAAGHYHSLALTADGNVIGWGAGQPGRSGFPHYGQSTIPAGLSGVSAIAAGEEHSLALDTQGQVYAWGRNENGQVNVPPGLTRAIGIAAGHYHNLAITAEGRVVQWGYRALDFPPPPGLSNVVAVAAGWLHNLALGQDGRVTAWGENSVGETEVPAGLSNVVSIAAGNRYSAALTRDGRFVRWGNPTSDLLAALPAPASNACTIEGGFFRYMALLGAPPGVRPPQLVPLPRTVGTADELFYLRVLVRNEVSGWSVEGLPNGLQMDPDLGVITGRPEAAGDFTITVFATNALGVSSEPLVIHINPPTLPSISLRPLLLVGQGLQVSLPIVGYYATSISVDGLPPGLAFNPNRFAIEGVATNPGLFALTVVGANRHGSVTNYSQLQVSPVLAWGDNFYDETNVPPITRQVIAVAAGSADSFALAADGQVIHWGGYPGWPLFPEFSNVIAIAAGYYHVLAIQKDGTVVGWGLSQFGETTPPPNLANVVAIAAGYEHSLALTASGRVVAWGGNRVGQGTVPGGLSNVVAIAAGNYHNIALTAEGRIVVWGQYWNGFNYSPPFVPSGLSNVCTVVAGASHDAALLNDGHVVAWGVGFSQTNVPAQLGNVVAIAATGWRTLVLTGDGFMGGWGYGTSAENAGLSSASHVVAFGVGDSHSLVVLGDPASINFPITLQAHRPPGGQNFRLTFPTRAGRVYVIERAISSTLDSWSFASLIIGDGGIRDYSDPLAGPHRIYRVRAMPSNR